LPNFPFCGPPKNTAILRKSYIYQELTIFLKCHKNVTKHTNPLEVDILIINKFVAILEASGRILTIECEKISFLQVKIFKTSWVCGDVIGMLSPQVVHIGGHKWNVRHETVKGI